MKGSHNILKLSLICFAFAITACGGGGGGGNPVDPGNGPYTVSGTVIDVNGNGVSGVTITFIAAGYDPYVKTTDVAGTYSFIIKDKATFSVTASLGSFGFNPTSRQVTVDKDITGIDFTLESTIIRFEPVSIVIPGIDQSDTVSVMIDNVSDLITATFTVQYDPEILEITDVIMSSLASLSWDSGDGLREFLVNTKSNQAFPDDSGTGMLARIVFRGVSTGSSQLTFFIDETHELKLACLHSGTEPEYYVPLPYTGSITVQ